MQVYPPPIILCKSKNNEKSDKDCVKNKLHRYLTSEKLDFYELKIALSDNDETKEFLLFVRSFQMTPEASGRLAAGAKIQYYCSLERGEALNQVETLSDEVGSTT